MNKKYIIISIVSVLVILIGVTIAYYSAIITGDRKKIVINTKELQVVFHNGEEINETAIEAPWETSKTFSVESKSPDIFYYNIVLQDLINGFTSNTLEYKITCTDGDGYSMSDFEPVPVSPEKSDQILIEGIELQPKATHAYTIEFKYDNKEDIDQSDDMGKTLSGSLYITKGEKKQILAEQVYEKMKEQYPNTIDKKREDYDSIHTEAGVFYEDGNFIETVQDNQQDRVYYYVGAVENNWVSFAGYYWRIIRTNEDGSIRLLYGGPANDKGNSQEQYIGSPRTYNGTRTDPRYVGFKYGDSGTLSSNRGNGTPAPILGADTDTNSTGSNVTLNGWYKANMNKSDGQTTYEWDKYISRTAVYCNDRAVPNGKYSTSSTFYYGAGLRLTTNSSSYGGVSQASNYHPSYKCGVDYQGNLIESSQAEADKFSGTNNSAKLTYPIGLITADEIAYAGGKFGTNSPQAYYYLTADGKNSATGTNYWWTMSPSNFNGQCASVFLVAGSYGPGQLHNIYVDDTRAVRPVVSLKSCVLLSESAGTAEDPFEVLPISDTCAQANN